MKPMIAKSVPSRAASGRGVCTHVLGVPAAVISGLLMFGWLSFATTAHSNLLADEGRNEASEVDSFRPTDRSGSETEGDRSLVDGVDAASLARRQFAERQHATMELWRRREFTRDTVQEAARNPDPEVAQRAQWILQQWRRGALPENPPDISRLLRKTKGREAVEELLEAGQFSAAIVAVEEVAGTLQRDETYARAAMALQRRFPIYVQRAIEQDALTQLLRLVDLVAKDKAMAVSRIELMRILGQEIRDENLLPSASESWAPAERRGATVLVLAVLGRLGDALRYAEESGSSELVRVCQMLRGDWHDLLTDSIQQARAAAPRSLEQTRYWCQVMVAADRAGDAIMFQEAADYLSSVSVDHDSVAANLSWQCLASHGEIEAGIELLKSINPDAAAQVAIAASRMDQVFEILGFPLPEVDRHLARWLEEAIAAQASLESGRLSNQIGRLLILMRALVAIGHDDAAWRIANTLSRSDVQVGNDSLRDSVLTSLAVVSGRSEWVMKLAVLPGERSISSQAEASLLATLRGTSSTTWKIMMDAFSTVEPDQPFDQRVRSVYELLRGKIPQNFDPDRDFKTLYERLAVGSPAAVRGRLITQSQPQINQEIADMFLKHGQVDLAARCMQQLLRRGELSAALAVAQRELDGGRLETAQRYFDFIWEQVAAQSQTRRDFRRGYNDVELATQAVVGKWTIARRQGDEQRIAALTDQLRLTLCTPSTELRRSLTGFLSDQHEKNLTAASYQSLLLMTAFGSEEGTEFVYVANDHSLAFRDDRPTEVARWFDLAISGTLETTLFQPIGYVTLPLAARKLLIEGAIDDADPIAVERHVDRLLRIDPIDIDFAERLLPKMREAGMAELADATFDKMFAQGKQHMRRFPFDATTGNNLAWVAAMNGRQIDAALKFARHAVDRQPDSAIYRDTLAEVLFQLGRIDEALQIEQACVLDDPGQWHLHEQIHKYKTALRSL